MTRTDGRYDQMQKISYDRWKKVSLDWFGREVSNSLRSCGLSETLFNVYVICAIANLTDISGLSISCSKIIK